MVLVGETMGGNTANSAQRQWSSVCGRSRQSENGAVWVGDFSLSLSLSLLALVARLWAKFKGLFTHFVVISSCFIIDFAHFIAISSYLVVNFSYFIAILSRLFVVAFRFIVILSCLFAYKRHFLGHCTFLKILNALFLGFLCLSLRAVFAKTAWQSINLALFLLFGLPRSPCSLAMTARLAVLSLCKRRPSEFWGVKKSIKI